VHVETISTLLLYAHHDRAVYYPGIVCNVRAGNAKFSSRLETLGTGTNAHWLRFPALQEIENAERKHRKGKQLITETSF
jgi:hypothetical protein